MCSALSKHSNLRSVLFREQQGTDEKIALYASIRSSDRWYDQCILDTGDTVCNVKDLRSYGITNTFLVPSYPGPLFKALIVNVKETGTAGVILNGMIQIMMHCSKLTSYLG